MTKLIKRFVNQSNNSLYKQKPYKPAETTQTTEIKGFNDFKYPSSIFTLR